jgi:hypothetical protein
MSLAGLLYPYLLTGTVCWCCACRSTSNNHCLAEVPATGSLKLQNARWLYCVMLDAMSVLAGDGRARGLMSPAGHVYLLTGKCVLVLCLQEMLVQRWLTRGIKLRLTTTDQIATVCWCCACRRWQSVRWCVLQPAEMCGAAQATRSTCVQCCR